MSTWYIVPNNSDLLHHGVKGMKWGVRKQYEYVGRRPKSSEYTSAKDKRLNSAKLSTLGGLIAGPALGIAGTVAGQKVSNEQAKKLVKIGANVLAVEAGLATGFAAAGTYGIHNVMRVVRKGTKIALSIIAIKNTVSIAKLGIEVATGKKALEDVLSEKKPEGITKKDIALTTAGLITGQTTVADLLLLGARTRKGQEITSKIIEKAEDKIKGGKS